LADRDADRLARRSAAFIAPLSCACWALLTHTLPFVQRVFQPFGLVLYGDGDVYYHLRRMRAIAAHWPRVPDFDRFMNFPAGAYAIWAPGFDFVPASLARLGLPIDRVAAFWPALLGAAACLPFYAYCRRCFGTTAAIGCSLILASLPAAVLIGALGRPDHHVAEGLAQLLIYAYLERCCAAFESGSPVRLRQVALLGMCMGGALLTWAGSLVFLIVPAALGVSAILFTAGPSAQRLRWLLVGGFALAALIALPYGELNVLRGRAATSPNFPSLLQPLACLLLAAAVHAVGWIAAASDRARLGRLGLVGLGAIACLCVPGVGSGLGQGLAFLTRGQSEWLTTIGEFAPLFSSESAFQFGIGSLGYTFLLIPLALLLHAARLIRRRSCGASDLLLLLFSGHVFVLSLLQIRFVHYAAPVVAFVPVWLHRLLREHSPRWANAAAALALALTYPALAYYAPLLHGADTSYPQLRADLFEMLNELPKRTPPAGDPSAPAARPQYCVFAPWDLGHFIVTIAQRPVVANNFGEHLAGGSYAESRFFFEEARDEAQALPVIEGRGCRYVITPARSPQLAADPNPPFARRLHDADGSDAAGQGSGRLRLVLETLGPPVSGRVAYKMFELVRGAELRVTVSARELAVETRLQTATRSFWYRRKLAREATNETFSVRLAYAGRYRLLRDGEPAFELNVPNEAVLAGKRIAISEH
jgi:asparagine N-glycosylation enzyme membrane subunit Stt3